MKEYYGFEEKHLPKGELPSVPDRNRCEIDGVSYVLLRGMSPKNITPVQRRPNLLAVGVAWPYSNSRKMGNVDVNLEDFRRFNPEADLTNTGKGGTYVIPLKGETAHFCFRDDTGRRVMGDIPVEYIYAEYEKNRKQYRKVSAGYATQKQVHEERVEKAEEVASRVDGAQYLALVEKEAGASLALLGIDADALSEDVFSL